MLEQLLANPDQITFTVLFVGLLVYVMRTNDSRENQYRETIDRLTSALGTLEDVEEKIDMLNSSLRRKDDM